MRLPGSTGSSFSRFNVSPVQTSPSRAHKEPAQPLLAKAAAQLQQLHRMLPTPRLEQEPQTQRAAYSLEELY
jgi:hypothetical protein